MSPSFCFFALAGLHYSGQSFPGLAPWALLFRLFEAGLVEPHSGEADQPRRKPWQKPQEVKKPCKGEAASSLRGHR